MSFTTREARGIIRKAVGRVPEGEEVRHLNIMPMMDMMTILLVAFISGYLDAGEDPRETAVKEVFEETNLRVEIGELVDVYFNRDAVTMGGASIFILYQATLLGGELRAGDDASAAKFFGPDELPELAFTSTLDVVGSIWRQ
jgi:ADP-ribose pyrophosphatase YjhB (NUDIX family)